MLSDNLEKTIKRAISYANDRQHEYVTLEHFCNKTYLWLPIKNRNG